MKNTTHVQIGNTTNITPDGTDENSIKNAADTAANAIIDNVGEPGIVDTKSVKLAKDAVYEMLRESIGVADDGAINISYAKKLHPDMAEEQLADIVAVKSVGKDKIFHYPFLWGTQDNPDIVQEFFTKSTNFWDNELKNAPRPLTWNHATDRAFKANPVIGSTLEWGDDEIGRWALSQLDKSHKYREGIARLIANRALGTSSDSAPQYVEREQKGNALWLKTWPWFASALTNTPCEPRMVDTVEFFKSLGIVVPIPEAPEERVRVMLQRATVIFEFNRVFGDYDEESIASPTY